ncbi:MAG TPA: hypothetical protein VGO59_21365 [Verrucomicrobiae bacterium]|jgi:hypothetical protein
MNRQLATKEKRTIRVAAVCVAIYLVLFYGPAVLGYFTGKRDAYDKLMQQARDLRAVIKPYEEKTETATNLMDRFRLDPAKLKRLTVMAEASDAIQKAAMSEGVGVGPIRETPGRASAKEAGSMQFDGTGQIPSVMAFLHHLECVGFPVVIDSAQFTPMGNMLKVSLTIVVLDFDGWKPKEEGSHV